jgi:hypothetical protein
VWASRAEIDRGVDGAFDPDRAADRDPGREPDRDAGRADEVRDGVM